MILFFLFYHEFVLYKMPSPWSARKEYVKRGEVLLVSTVPCGARLWLRLSIRRLVV